MGHIGKLCERRYQARSVEPRKLGGLPKATVRRNDPEGVVRAGMDPAQDADCALAPRTMKPGSAGEGVQVQQSFLTSLYP